MKQALTAWVQQEEERERLTREALTDVDANRVIDHQAAAHTVQSPVSAPSSLLENPCIGEQLFEFSPREIRRITIGQYEMRYEIQESTIYLLRLWHTRESR